MLTDDEYHRLRAPHVEAIERLHREYQKLCEPHVRALMRIETIAPNGLLKQARAVLAAIESSPSYSTGEDRWIMI